MIAFYREYVSKTAFTDGIVLSKNFYLLPLSSLIDKKNLIVIDPYLQSQCFSVDYSRIDLEDKKEEQKH